MGLKFNKETELFCQTGQAKQLQGIVSSFAADSHREISKEFNRTGHAVKRK